MYRYSNGVNLVAGGEKHRVYVKKSPTGVGKGVKGHVMVNHPTTDKGKWDTIDLTKKAGAKTVEDGKNATKKWHAENPYLSGAKSVKQYRGDENLPEAKNGMKNCGCKHTRSKYKYQDGERDIAADRLEFGEAGAPRKRVDNSDNENLDFSIDYDLPKSVKSKLNAMNAPRATPIKNTVVPRVIRKDTVPVIKENTPVKKDTVSRTQRKTYPTVSGEKKIYIEKAPVSKRNEEINNNDPYSARKNYTDRVKKYIGNYDSEDYIPQRDITYKLVDGKFVTVLPKKRKFAREKLDFDYEDLSPKEQNQIKHELKLQRAEELKKEIDVMNRSMKYRTPEEDYSAKYFLRGQKFKEMRDIQDNVKKITSAVEGKSPYKYGTGALTIPEGSAIVTANGGKNKQALAAYKKGNYKLLNKIIDDMPEDRVSKKQSGTNDLKSRYQYLAGLTGPLSEEQNKELENIKTELTKPSYDLYDDKRIAEKFGQKYDVDKAKYRSSLKGGNLKLIEDTKNVDYRNRLRNEPAFFQEEMKAGRVTVDKNGNVAYKPKGTHSKNAMEFLGTSKAGELPAISTTSTTTTPSTPPGTGGTPPPGTPPRKRGFNFPSLAEVAARASILGQGIEGVPENYLKLGRYQYASQLPKTLREIQLAEQTGKESARDIVGGDAGRYLAQAGSLSSARMKAANEAVIQDTLARQDIANKNVDLGNKENEVNTGLKNQYAALRGQARAAYNDQLVALGQRIDSASETAQEMANQRAADEQRLQTLRDLGINYDIKDIDGLLKLVPKTSTNTPSTTTTSPEKQSKKGLKRVKAYKRR